MLHVLKRGEAAEVSHGVGVALTCSPPRVSYRGVGNWDPLLFPPKKRVFSGGGLRMHKMDPPQAKILYETLISCPVCSCCLVSRSRTTSYFPASSVAITLCTGFPRTLPHPLHCQCEYSPCYTCGIAANPCPLSPCPSPCWLYSRDTNLRQFAAMAISGGRGQQGASPPCPTLPLLYLSTRGHEELTVQMAGEKVLSQDKEPHTHWTVLMPMMTKLMIKTLYPIPLTLYSLNLLPYLTPHSLLPHLCPYT